MNNSYWGFKVKTNTYAGNFEREICSYMAGQIGECGVGKNFIDENITNKFSNIKDLPDDYGCYRPVQLDESDSNNLIIFFETEPTKEQIEILKKRSYNFKENSNFGDINILGFELILFGKYGTLITKY
jgi:hypothetical protein